MNGTRGVTSPVLLWLLHLSFTAAVPLYGVISWFILVKNMGGRGPALDPKLLLVILAAITVTNITLAAGLGRKLHPRQGAAAGYLAQATTCLIVTDACYEAIAIYGLVGIVLGLPPGQGFIFMGVSLLFLVGRIPQLRNWSEEYQRLKTGENAGE